LSGRSGGDSFEISLKRLLFDEFSRLGYASDEANESVAVALRGYSRYLGFGTGQTFEEVLKPFYQAVLFAN
jgi:hypothetical protein